MRCLKCLLGSELVCIVAFFSLQSIQAQDTIPVYKRQFQLSLFPGISTNGISSGKYTNNFSFNIFGGTSAGNRILEIGLFSNSNFQSVTGVQLTGFANVIGANAFLNLSQTEKNNLILNGFESSSKGLQAAGLLNFVLDKATGLQIAGGLNSVGDDFKGVQLAGIGNSVGAASQFVQLAGVFNITAKSMRGFQISSLLNYAGLELSGLQLGLFNKAGWIRGKRSMQPTSSRGWQIGLINFCREMDGLQIGLINFGGPAGGTQIGLINFFSKYGAKRKEFMGTPIGLLNIGSRGSYLRVSYNEVFLTNIEYTTGNCQNCTWTQSGMPYKGKNRIFNQNALIAGYDPQKETWGFGYGFQKVLYDKKTMLPNSKTLKNERRLLRYGIKFIQLNKQGSISNVLNLLNRINFDYGRKFKGFYFFAGTSVNYLMTDVRTDVEQFLINSYRVEINSTARHTNTLWLGFETGIQLNITTLNPWEL